MKNKLRLLYFILLGLLVILSAFVYSLTKWFKHTFGVTFDLIYYHLHVPLEGTHTNFVSDATRHVLPFVLAFIALFVIYILFEKKILDKMIADFKIKIGKLSLKLNLKTITRIICMALAVCVAFGTFKYMDNTLKIIDFVKATHEQSHIYEDYYVDPDEITITDPEKKKNLIYIYLESMETTYTSREEGGEQEHNYMPHLTEMAK